MRRHLIFPNDISTAVRPPLNERYPSSTDVVGPAAPEAAGSTGRRNEALQPYDVDASGINAAREIARIFPIQPRNRVNVPHIDMALAAIGAALANEIIASRGIKS